MIFSCRDIQFEYLQVFTISIAKREIDERDWGEE